MKKKLLKVFTSLSLLALIVSGCGENTTSESSSSTNVNDSSSDNQPSNSQSNDEVSSEVSDEVSSESSNENSSSSSEEVKETYKIIVASTGNATVELSTNQAAADEVVTINVTVDDGYRLDRIEVNGKTISSTSFIMPNTSVIINVYTTLVDKDGYIIDGDVSAKLVDEGNGIYVARNVSVQSDSYVVYNIDGVEQSVTKIDNRKSFANISLTGVGNQNGFMIAGNAVYDFYYDPTDLSTPCYVQRVGVINLPTTEGMVYSLFAGSAKSESTVYPANVNHVEYYSSVRNDKYTWDLYENNSSFAKVVNPITNKEKAIVYKAQIGDVYKVVDNYLEGSTSTYYPKDKNYETSSDITPYSANYDIVKAVAHRNYEVTQDFVDDDSTLYSHSMGVLDAEFYDAYRNGFVNNIYNDVTVDHGQQVTSTRLDNNDFTVNLDTWVRWSNSANYESSMGYRSAFIKYDLDITFTAAGAIKEGVYSRTIYSEAYYDFATNTFKAGFDTVEPEKYVTFAYGYGDPLKGHTDYDVSKYFTQSISDIKVKGKNSSNEGTLSVTEDLKASVVTAATNENNVTFVCNPVTALDGWQYGIVSSSNVTVIGPKSTSTPYDFRALASGKATITIANHTKNANDVTATYEITVANAAFIKGLFMYTVYPYPNYDDAFNSSNGTVACGRSYELQLAAKTTSSNYVYNNMDLTLTVKENDGIVDFSYDDTTGKLTIDATNSNVSNTTTVKLVLSTPYLVDGWPETTLTFYVTPRENYESSVMGTWTEGEGTSSITFTSETEGVIYYAPKNVEYTFSYTYDLTSGKITITQKPSISGMDHVDLRMYVDSTDGALCVYFASEAYDWGSYSSEYYAYFGYDYGDEYGENIYYQVFIKN
ncbi:MAG: hypothetical protein MR270_04135 [Erysipelotrichaceae bacterium]|nr:hypothetical protein [Erysipelotrichaceae bacterium]